MPSFSYRAVDTNGSVVKGTLEANSVGALEQQLRHSGMELLKYAERRNAGSRGKVGRKDLIGFCFHMQQMTHAGLPIIDALSDLRDSLDNPVFQEVIGNVIASVETGKTLSQALGEYPNVFDDIFVSLITVGEESGELPAVLKKLTDSLKWQDELISKARTVIIYPAFVGTVVFGVLLFMMLYVVPQMTDFMQDMGQALPAHTRALIAFSDFLTGNWWWAVPAPFVTVVLIRLYAARSPDFKLKLDGVKLKFWYTGPILTKILLSRFASYFSLCYSAGMNVLASLKICEDIAGNMVVRNAIEEISVHIADGKTLSASIEETGLFPPLVVRMVRMGESTGNLDESLDNVSYFYDREVTEAIDRLKAMIEPAMTVVLGAIMGWIMLSVLGPIYDTISNLGV